MDWFNSEGPGFPLGARGCLQAFLLSNFITNPELKTAKPWGQGNSLRDVFLLKKSVLKGLKECCFRGDSEKTLYIPNEW